MMNLLDFSAPVHRSLQSRELLGGVPHEIMLGLLILGVVMVYTARLYIFLPVIVLLYILARILTKKDQYLLEIFLCSLQQDDLYIP